MFYIYMWKDVVLQPIEKVLFTTYVVQRLFGLSGNSLP